MTNAPSHHPRLLELLVRLKAAHIFHRLSDPTEGALTVEIAVPGERWEIEFHEDGEIGVEVFVSKGVIQGPDLLKNLFRRFCD